MISCLRGHISERQINVVLSRILNQYAAYKELIGSTSFTRIFAEEYTPHNRQHSVSWAISSAFPSETILCDDIEISRLVYGKGHTRPQLNNSKLVFHILNKTTHFNANYLKEYYELNDSDFQNEKLYCYFKFEVVKQSITKIELCLPNADGSLFESELLYDSKNTVAEAA